MKLRRQLVLVSLLTLALPWAGCEYIREMENTLRQGQAAALLATAQAVAARLASDPATRQLIASPASPATEANAQLLQPPPLYAHPLKAAPVVDGYDDDWRSLGLTSQTWVFPTNEPHTAKRFQVAILAGEFDNSVFLFCRVSDDTPQPYRPQASLDVSDHLQLWLRSSRAKAEHFHIYTAAPGKVTIVDGNGHREHQISGFWQDWRDGYQVELQLPRAWAEHLGLGIVNATGAGVLHLGHASTPETLPPLMLRNSTLDAALAVFTNGANQANNGSLLRLASSDGWIIAQAGDRRQPEPLQALEGNQILTRLYRLALGKQDLPAIPNPGSSGRFDSEEVEQALAGLASAQWYRGEGAQVVRVAVPVVAEPATAGDTPIGAVVAEQSTNILNSMTDSAFSRLVSYSLAAFAIAGLGLLAYATWLSWRIRRLSRAAERAVDANGRISRNFPHSYSRDEIGELSRRYSELLERLRQYNNYLETLASKLSHELRTPLAVVRSSLDNLEHEPLTPQAVIYSERAKGGAERLSTILSAMSAASRVEQSINSAELEPVDLHSLLRELTAAYTDAYPSTHWAFQACEGDYRLKAAPELLVQMLDKLADNAADFSPEGGLVRIDLSAQGQHLVIAVSNSGPPLPESMRGQLFDSLVSIREGQDGGQHLGLGLYIVRLITEFHRGTVVADNLRDGSGAVFTVRLPRERE